MLNMANDIKGCALAARDGNIGTAKEFYFDDQYWALRYLVADTGGWLPGRQVLLSPHSLGTVNRERREVAVDSTRQQIKSSPSLDEDKPVSRQFEESYYGYYGYPTYWGGPFMWGPTADLERDRTKWRENPREGKQWNAHLRSSRETSGYRLQAADGEIGHVEDFVVEDELWAIRYLLVDTRNWWPGRRVLVSPQWIERVSWGESKFFVSLTRAEIEKSPVFTGAAALNRDYESLLYRHYQRPGYWDEIHVEHVGTR